MLKNTYINNEQVKVNSKEIEKLKNFFPQYFSCDGSFKIVEFKKMLQEEEINFNKEGYELNFLGKSYARFESSLDTETVITPVTNHNDRLENKDSENIYIVGDNLDALKHLVQSYSNKIKCIYIDPPYNTGEDDFVYPDQFKYDKTELSEKMGVEEEEAERILELSGKSTHSAWLTFMYPRLIIARDLLTEDGVIFISIDDNEHANLKLICNEIFGEDRLVVDGSVIVKPEGRRYGSFAKTHENFLAYSKTSSDNLALNEITIEGKTFKYTDKYGGFNTQELRNQNAKAFNSTNRPNLRYPFYVDINNPDKNNFCEVSLNPNDGWEEVYPIITNGNKSVWRWGKGEGEKATKNLHNICARKGTDGVIRVYEKVRKITEMPKTIFIDNKFLTITGTRELDETFGAKVFDFPKPVGLVKELISIGSEKDSIILDFFSGSATTAEAVLQLNAEDKGNRKYILVQLEETIKTNKPAYQNGFKSIDEIGRKRIENTVKKLKYRTDENLDYGYKLFYLNKPTQKTIMEIVEFNPNETSLITEDFISPFAFKKETGKSTILTTWLNKDNYGLLAKTEKINLNNYEADLIEESLYLIEPGLESNDIMKLVSLLEKNELLLKRIVVYGYSLEFNIFNELRTNIKNLKNGNKITLIERF